MPRLENARVAPLGIAREKAHEVESVRAQHEQIFATRALVLLAMRADLEEFADEAIVEPTLNRPTIPLGRNKPAARARTDHGFARSVGACGGSGARRVVTALEVKTLQSTNAASLRGEAAGQS